MIRAAAMILGIFLPFAASAQTVRLEGYLHPKNETFRTFNQLYLAGVVDGLILYSVSGADKLFCIPGKLALTTEQAENILLSWAKKQTKNTNDLPIGIALLGGLEETFPCDK
jgi:Rap1a immunity proteins